jgi:hypothetical protein
MSLPETSISEKQSRYLAGSAAIGFAVAVNLAWIGGLIYVGVIGLMWLFS